jgi:biotin carboxyl carrier protein
VTYQVAINGRMRRVEIDRAGGLYVVTVDGHRHVADVTPISGGSSLILGGEAARRSYEVAIAEHPPASGTLVVYVNGRLITAAVGTPRGSWARRGQEAGEMSGAPVPVTAPMPGKVVKLLVQPGEAVTARQGLVVVEAMKMENELRAPRAGIVASVKVAEGSSVEAGTVLAIIE